MLQSILAELRNSVVISVRDLADKLDTDMQSVTAALEQLEKLLQRHLSMVVLQEYLATIYASLDTISAAHGWPPPCGTESEESR